MHEDKNEIMQIMLAKTNNLSKAYQESSKESGSISMEAFGLLCQLRLMAELLKELFDINYPIPS